MTEKRFVADNEYVMQNGEVYVVCGGEHSADVVATALNELLTENEQLKKELFESEKDYIMETYSDNPIKRDEKIQLLKEEFKEKFGDFE